MTGFGSGRREGPDSVVTVEVKAVNHRYLDVHVRLPGEFQSLEPVVRKKLGASLSRGRVDVTLGVERGRRGVRVEADPELIEAWVDLIRDLQRQFHVSGEVTVESLTRLPGAISVTGQEPSEEEDRALVALVEEALDQALGRLVGMRRAEGEALGKDLLGRTARMRANLGAIREAAPLLISHYRERLAARMAELSPPGVLESGRLEAEALVYADKSDITEEITRLESHLDQFDAAMEGEDETGKRLDFLLQEMNREVTTILSKTSGLSGPGTRIGEAAIENKVEIDKLREQVQNVE
jgi:uncharacterized protein (TIGR00255 family)